MRVLHPGRLTAGYVQGQRVRYVSPLALFLFCVFLLFLTAGHSTLNMRVVTDGPADEERVVSAADLPAPADPSDTVIDLHLRDAAWPAVRHRLLQALNNPDLAAYRLKEKASKYSFLLIPLLLPLLWMLFFRRRDLKLFDHLIFTAHSLSFMALLGSVAALGAKLLA